MSSMVCIPTDPLTVAYQLQVGGIRDCGALLGMRTRDQLREHLANSIRNGIKDD